MSGLAPIQSEICITSAESTGVRISDSNRVKVRIRSAIVRRARPAEIIAVLHCMSVDEQIAGSGM